MRRKLMWALVVGLLRTGPAVARHGRRLFVACEVGQPLKAGIDQDF